MGANIFEKDPGWLRAADQERGSDENVTIIEIDHGIDLDSYLPPVPEKKKIIQPIDDPEVSGKVVEII